MPRNVASSTRAFGIDEIGLAKNDRTSTPVSRFSNSGRHIVSARSATERPYGVRSPSIGRSGRASRTAAMM